LLNGTFIVQGIHGGLDTVMNDILDGTTSILQADGQGKSPFMVTFQKSVYQGTHGIACHYRFP
jgi:hypothetical protein